jgi:hypothetical protein
MDVVPANTVASSASSLDSIDDSKLGTQSSSLSAQFQILPQVLLLLQKIESGDEKEVLKVVRLSVFF